MASIAPALPHWDMTVVYPSLKSPAFADGYRAAVEGIHSLVALFDELGIGQRSPAPLDDRDIQAFERVIERYNAVLECVQTVGAYISSFVATNSRDDVAQAKLSEMQWHFMRLDQLSTRFVAWIGSLDVEALLARSHVAPGYQYLLRRTQEAATHLMSPAEEKLAAEMNLTGGSAWSKLHPTVTSQLTAVVDGEPLPMSVVRTRAHDADREVRRKAYEAELAAWETVTVPLAAALNSIKGEVNLLTARRNWDSPLDAALFDSAIDCQTLDAMMEAARAFFPDFRRYLKAKARLLGLPALAWYDLYAPVGTSVKEWSYDEADAFIVEHFTSYSPRLRDLAARAFRERWIDAEPRAGKRDGGFCMRLSAGESRILVNYSPAFDAVSTLAHELGHAYHNLNLARNPMLLRDTPMTLAETASIFCETIILQAGLAQANPAEQLALLEQSLQGQGVTVVDITSRFLFEQRVFEARREHGLSVDDFNRIMLDTQRETYGDGLDQALLHPFMWAVKGHYYRNEQSFYNYPYMFGFLFGLGLYARYKADPERFKSSYDELLASTGTASAADLAARFGIDIRTPAFWHASLDVVRADIDRFVSLAVSGDTGATQR